MLLLLKIASKLQLNSRELAEIGENWLGKERRELSVVAGQFVVTGESFHVYLHLEKVSSIFLLRWLPLVFLFPARELCNDLKKVLNFDCNLNRVLLNCCLIYCQLKIYPVLFK